MFDISDLENHVPIPGTPWTLAPWTFGMMAGFGAWLRLVTPDPIDEALRFIDGLPTDEAKALRKEASATAKQLANPTLECPLVQEVLKTSVGQVEFLWLRLHANHAEVTRDDVFRWLLSEGRKAAAVFEAKDDSPAGE